MRASKKEKISAAPSVIRWMKAGIRGEGKNYIVLKCAHGIKSVFLQLGFCEKWKYNVYLATRGNKNIGVL